MLWARAPGIGSIQLQESTNLIDWTHLGTWPLVPEGTNFELGDPLSRDLRFIRWVVP